jgi:molecular chaperone DnaK
MVKDAAAHSDEDKRRKELVEAKNQGDAAVHSTERAMSEHGDKIVGADKEAIESALADLKSTLEGEDVAAIQAKTQTLMQASMKLGEAMYQAAQGQGGGDDAQAGPTSSNDEGVVDAEFEEVDDNKKSA